jgi:hypothetical protein
MRRVSRKSEEFDPTNFFFSLSREAARSIAAEVTEAVLADSPIDPLDEERGHKAMAEALQQAWPNILRQHTRDLLGEIITTCHSLASASWMTLGTERPEGPEINRKAIFGALFIHLHGTPDGPAAELGRARHEAYSRLFASGRWRAPTPSKDARLDYARGRRDVNLQLVRGS